MPDMTPVTRIRGAFARLRAPLLVALTLLFAVSAAHAQIVKPWTPAGDELVKMATDAKAKFKFQQTDSIGADDYPAYEAVGQMARKLLSRLGRENLLQAEAIESTLDSLGLDVEVAQDLALPSIVSVLVRNPNRPGAQCVGYLFWYRQNDLRMQGASYPAARELKMRAWWTGRPDSPYEVAILYRPKREAETHPGFKLFRMAPDGLYWTLVQYEGHGPELGPMAESAFADVNGDGQPELVVFNKVDPDSFFVVRPGVQSIANEFIYTERTEGFVLHDARTVPGPLETLRAFAELLQDRQTERAQRIMFSPEKIHEAVANGWLGLRRNGSWEVMYGEQLPWPTWFAVRVTTAAGSKKWIFHTSVKDGRWVVHDWIPLGEPRPETMVGEPPANAGAPPAARPRAPGVRRTGAARDTTRTHPR